MIFGSNVHGYVRVKVAGEGGERLLNRLTGAEVPLWDVDFREENLSFSVPLASLSFVRRAALSCGCFVTVQGRGGLPFVWKNMKRRRYSWFTALFVFCLLCLFLSMAWRVDIVAETDSNSVGSLKKEIFAVIEDCGVSPPVLKAAVDAGAVSNAILARCPSLSWVGLSFDGVTMTVSLAERSEEEKTAADCGHVVAAKDGVVRQILVLKGQKQVEADATVKKGDILISGYLTYEEEGREPVYDETSAKGVVTASVWYDGTAYVGLEQVVPEVTGRNAGIVTLSNDDKSYILWGNEENPFSDFITETQSLSLFGWTFDVKTYCEAIPRKKNRFGKSQIFGGKEGRHHCPKENDKTKQTGGAGNS